MTAEEALKGATRRLRRAHIDSPALDAKILLAHATHISKEKLLAHPERTLTGTEVKRFLALIRRRAAREPVAYITGRKWFYGLDFTVSRSVLIPRPETETLVEAALSVNPSAAKQRRGISRDSSTSVKMTIIDVGTGSGAIAIALAKHLPRAHVYATDNSEAALRVARANARQHGVEVTFFKANLLRSSREANEVSNVAISPIARLLRRSAPRNDRIIITANLPYLPTREWRHTQPEIKKYEPRRALDGGPDGLRYYRKLLRELSAFSFQCPVVVALEFDPEQTAALQKIVCNTFPKAKIEIKKDLAGRNRLLIAHLPSESPRTMNREL